MMAVGPAFTSPLSQANKGPGMAFVESEGKTLLQSVASRVVGDSLLNAWCEF